MALGSSTTMALEDPCRRRVGLLYDERMCRHATPDGKSHPENPERIRAIWRKLESEGIPQRCVVLSAKEAEDKHIASVHSQSHIKLIRNISSREFDSGHLRTASKSNSVYFNEGSSEAAYLAAGSLIEVSEKVAKGDLDSAIAIVRPPGHHAESDKAMGFCLFNNVAIAANILLNERPELGVRKILIVDWDVHHGNGTQNMFYKDHRVLYFSVHRFDFGSFYPVGGDGSCCMVGEGPGVGYNINVPWEHGQCGDADYMAVWDHLLLPVTESYNPDIILISAGFDSAVGDPVGRCCITPYGYSLMLKKLMRFAQGKMVMALEGGYNHDSIANSVIACAKVLLEGKPLVGSIETQPFESTWRVVQEVRHELKAFWPSLALELPLNVLVSNGTPCPVEVNLSSSSESEVEDDEGVSSTFCSTDLIGIIDEDYQGKVIASNHIPAEQSPVVLSEECPNTQALMPDHNIDGCIPWRSVLSKIEVWYGSYGSNMWKPRFLCYIEGGKVEGMNEPCPGSRDKSSPKEVIWKTVPHRLFFARSRTRTWGEGGVAFLHPESNKNEKAYMCLYRITLEQFNDVLLQENSLHQENGKSQGAEAPLLDLSDIDVVAENKSLPLEALKDGWYSNVLYLGEEDNLPVLTMTCPYSETKRFKSDPSNGYMNTLVRGLVEGGQLTKEEAIAYLNAAAATEI